MNAVQEKHGAKTSPEFSAVCEHLAQVQKEKSWSVARNGKIIEQSQILTTQNLASLFSALNLRPALSGRLRELCEKCFLWILKRQPSKSWKANLRMTKNSAYAWRQMVFFLSLVDSAQTLSFVQWMRGQVLEQKSSRLQQLEPAMAGLEWVATGGSFDPQGIGGGADGRRFLGWTTERHWLLGPEQKKAVP